MAPRTKKLSKTVTVKIDDTKWVKIQKDIKKLDKAFTYAGIFSESMNVDGQSLAAIGLSHEFGLSVPERSFMRSWFDKNIKTIQKQATMLYSKVLDGKLTADRAIKLLGAYAEGEIKKSIVDLKTPSNDPKTIARKGSSNPLIDTGQMLGSVKHKESKGKKYK